MSPSKRKLLKKLGIVLGILAILLSLFVIAFVHNPMEGRLVDVRDIVPREVHFFVRKLDAAADFAAFPEPVFWADFADSQTWRDLQQGPLVRGLRADGAERLLQQVADGVRQAREQSGGWIDPVRDILGTEVVLTGYFDDRTGASPQPLAEPWWGMFARVSWRARAAWNVARWGLVQSRVADQGVQLQNDGPVMIITPQGGQPIYAARHLDCLMVANNRHLVDQALRLAEGFTGEQPFGQSAKYVDGVQHRLDRWVEVTAPEEIDALEFSVDPNLTDGFRRFAAGWPDPNNQDSMEQRVLASFLNLKGWNSISGALMFEPERLSFTGEVVMNSHMHTAFQSQFFRSEAQAREKWLDPFLRMVPENACAAAALRMPAGEFMHAMYDALTRDEKDLLNDMLRRVSLQGQQVNDCRDLIDRIKIALLPRTGFVFRKNVPDTSRDKQTGELLFPVAALSATPQIAWVFWIREGSSNVLDDLVRMLQTYSQSVFGFRRVFNLNMSLDGGGGSGQDVVWEFANPQIPGTGQIAALVFRDFFVLSNSGPLIKDMFRARYGTNGARSIMETDEARVFARELPQALNGCILVRGPELAAVFDDYRAMLEQVGRDPDPGWMAATRPQIEDLVRKDKYAQYSSVAGIPGTLRPQFDAEVDRRLREQWTRLGSGYGQADLAKVVQFRTIFRAMAGAYVQVELENNYIRFQGKALLDYR